jgi:HK97 family phage major capsid protein
MEEITKAVDDMAQAVTAQREKVDALEKKYDGVNLESLKKMDSEIEILGQKISDAAVAQEGAQKAADQQMEIMQKTIGQIIAGMGEKGEQKGEMSEVSKAFTNFLRSSRSESAYEKMLESVADSIIKKEAFGGDSEKIVKDLVLGSDGDGGYLAPTEFGATIMGRIFETSPVRSVANVITTAASEISFVLDDDEPDAGWVGEVDSRDDTSTPKVGQIIIPAHEIFAQPKATQKLLDDAGVNVEQWLAGKVSRKIGRVENTSFVVGDGSQKPKGFLSYAAWTTPGEYERNAVEQINSGISASFDGDSFKTLQNSLIEDYQASAVFMMKRATWSNVTKLKDNEDRYLFDMISNFRDGDTLQVLGKRVILANDMPDQAADSLSVVYGDFGEGYTIADRIGIRVLRDPYTSKPFIKFYTTKRTGGAVTNYEALKIMKLAV